MSLTGNKTSPVFYIIENSEKRAFDSGTQFEELGYSWDGILEVPDQKLTQIITGDPSQGSAIC